VARLEGAEKDDGHRRTRVAVIPRQHGSIRFLHALDGGERILVMNSLIRFLLIDFQSETGAPIDPVWGPVPVPVLPSWCPLPTAHCPVTQKYLCAKKWVSSVVLGSKRTTVDVAA
jgi:hypothetical protein